MSKTCPACQGEVESNVSTCDHCGQEFIRTRAEDPRLFGSYRDGLNRFTDFNGRTSRMVYWRFFFANIIIVFTFVTLGVFIALISFILEIPLLAAVVSMLWVMLSIAYSVVIFLPLLAISIRRLHDQDRPAWYLFVNLIPWIGPFVFLLLMAIPGTAYDNRYGNQSDNEEHTWNT